MTAALPRVRFPRGDRFHAALKRRVAAHFEETGRPRWGEGAMHAKTAAILGWFACSYALLLLWGGTSAWLAGALTLSIALATAGIGFSVMQAPPWTSRHPTGSSDGTVGGLNFQVEHHLFPDVCHTHYPALASVVEATCLAHEIPYRTERSLRRAIAAHFRFLREVGRADGEAMTLGAARRADRLPLPSRELMTADAAEGHS